MSRTGGKCTPKKRAVLALVLVAAAVLAARAVRDRHARRTVSGPRLVVAADGGTATFGSLALARCELARKAGTATAGAFCATVPVPENWDDPSSRRIDLRVAVVASAAAAPEPDVVAFLAGGPGQAATEVYPDEAPAFTALNRERHVLLVDQRGTGGSNPLTCPEDQEALDQADAGLDLAKVRRAVEECLARVRARAEPRFYTTTDAVRDLEAVRVAAGGPRLDLVGVSYGTRLAQRYLATYPHAVRSAILDSAVPGELALGADFATNLDAVLRKHFAACGRDPACARAFGDPYASLYRLRDALQARAVEVSYRSPRTFELRTRRLSGQELGALVRLFAYTPETAALLPLALREAENGRYAALMAQAELSTEGLGDLAANVMQFSVVCAEDLGGLAVPRGDEHLIVG
jgi:pimeloyl-ACP methyl ester carboxylesterase